MRVNPFSSKYLISVPKLIDMKRKKLDDNEQTDQNEHFLKPRSGESGSLRMVVDSMEIYLCTSIVS